MVGKLRLIYVIEKVLRSYSNQFRSRVVDLCTIDDGCLYYRPSRAHSHSTGLALGPMASLCFYIIQEVIIFYKKIYIIYWKILPWAVFSYNEVDKKTCR